MCEKRRRTAGPQAGFTLIELLIVVAIIGLLAAIAIPSLLNSVQRGKQSGTMGDMRAMVSALEHYAVDHDLYPVTSDLDELASVLQPDYVKLLPRNDAWGRAFVYDSGDGSTYTLSSLGKDGQPQGSPPAGVTHSFEADIIASDGSFLQWPAREQK